MRMTGVGSSTNVYSTPKPGDAGSEPDRHPRSELDLLQRALAEPEGIAELFR